MKVRVRLGSGLARLVEAPVLTVELDDGATVADLFARVPEVAPAVAPALRSVLPIVSGEHAERSRPLHPGDEVALLLPVSGG